MKNNHHILTIGVAIGSIFCSCSKTKDKVSTPTSTVTSVSASADSIFNMLRLQPKVFSVDATNGGSYYGNSGTRYVFAPNSFHTATGAAVTGTIQVSATEYLQKGDMLFSKMLPVSNNQALYSGGELNISATQNGQPVYLNYNSTFQANMPFTGTMPANMQLFVGRQNKDTAKMLVNWVVPAVDSNKYHANAVGFIEHTGSGGVDTFSIISDSLRQCNADAFMTWGTFDYLTFTVKASAVGATINANTVLFGYTIYDTYKGVWPLGAIGSYANGVFTEQHVPAIPVHFAIFGLIDGKFYGGVIGATPASGGSYTVPMTQVDPKAFKAQLNTL